MSNSHGMTRHSWYAGMVAVCISDHLWKDKVNYLSRYDVLSVRQVEGADWLEKHFCGVCLEITGRDNIHRYLVPVEMFVPASYYDGDVMRNDEKALADPQPVVKRTDTDKWLDGGSNADNAMAKQAQQFENVPDTFSIADREILGKLEATGKQPKTNPKAVHGDKKPRLTLAPLSAQMAQVEAHLDGALKYGWLNWREVQIQAQTYIDAAMRHLRLYENGEDYARDTKVYNLGAVMACCAILIDSELHGTMVDNRAKSPATCDMLHERGEYITKLLNDMQVARNG